MEVDNDARTLCIIKLISRRYADIMIGTVIHLIFWMRNCNTILDYESLKLGDVRLKR